VPSQLRMGQEPVDHPGQNPEESVGLWPPPAIVHSSTAPPVGLLRTTRKALVPSTKPSFKIGTTMVLLVSPAPKAKVPEIAVYFGPAVAVPLLVHSPRAPPRWDHSTAAR
jgi:hypothetical protein